MLKRYLDGLINLGFVEARGDAYALTPKGLTLRKDMERVLAHFVEDMAAPLAAERIRRFGSSA